MLVAICDDNSAFRKIIIDFLLTYKRQRRICLDIIEFDNGQNLLKSDKIFDIVFLDYQMPDIDGLKTARIFRNQNALAEIIFITAYPHFVFDSFEVQPFRFLIKPIKEKEIILALDDFIAKQKLLYPIILVANGERMHINSYDIIYVEADGKYSIVVTTNGCFHTAKTISQIQELLPKHCFYRTHRSFLINMYFISKINKNQILLNNGQYAKISKPILKSFQKDYLNFTKNFFLKV